MNEFLHGWFYDVSDISIRFALLFLLALPISYFGHANPHRQSILWRTVLLGLVAITLWSLAIPRWNLDIPVADTLSHQPQAFENRHTQYPSDHKSASNDLDLAVERNISTTVDDFSQVHWSANSAVVPAPTTVPATTNKWLASVFFVWFLVTCVLLIRIVFACFVIGTLKRKSQRIEHEQRVFYQCASIAAPMVVGFFRGRILLPLQWVTWSPDKLRAIVAHEHAHIDRHDLPFAFFAEILSACFWFHPCVWLAKSFLRSSSELACDYAAIRSGNDRYQYARVLLDVAHPAHNLQVLHLAMTSRGNVRQRVTQILADAIAANLYFSLRQKMLLFSGLSVCLLLLCICAPRLISQEGKELESKTYSVAEWLVSNDGAAEITIHGVVLNPDGTPAVGSQVEAILWKDTYYKEKTTKKLDCIDGRFSITLPGLANVDLLAANADGTLMSEHAIYAQSLRKVCERDYVIRLQASQSFTVDVPNIVEGETCTASLKTYRFECEGIANQSGRFKFQLPSNTEVLQLFARTNNDRIGWKDLSPGSGRPDHHNRTEITLNESEPLRINLIDSTGNPVAGAKIQASFAQGIDRIISESLYTAKTDSSGQATINLAPKGDKFQVWFQVNNADIRGQELKERSITLTQPLDSKGGQVPFRGQLKLPEQCEGGLLITGISFQNIVPHYSTPFFARCDSDGNFEGMVTPGYTYSIHVDDETWVSDYWTGIPAKSTDQGSDTFSLSVQPGVAATIRLTGGTDNRPIQAKDVDLDADHTFKWTEKGETKYGGGGRRLRVKTDTNGLAHVRLFPGEYRIRAYNGQGRVEKTVQVARGQLNAFDLHFDVVGKHKINGKLAGDASVIAGATVVLKQADMLGGEGEVSVLSGPDGSYSAEVEGNQTLVYASSKDNAYIGTRLFDTKNGDFIVEMIESGSLTGQVLDSENKPVANGTMRAFAKLQNPKYQAGSQNVPQELHAKRIELTTDADGKFHIDALPAQVKITVLLDTGKNTGRMLEDSVFQPGEDRVKLYDYKQRKQLPFESRFAQLLNDTRLTHTRALVVIHCGDELANEFVDKHALNFNDHPDVGWYLPVLFNMKTVAEKPELLASFQRRSWPEPAANSLWLLVLDDKEQELGRVQLDVSNDSAARDSILLLERFLRDQRLDELDANAIFDSAAEDAKNTDRSLWVCISQTRCQPCFVLARWQDENRSLLSKAFVMLKVDDVRDISGYAKKEELVAGNGVPWHTMLNPQGETLINSNDPVIGNIGAPDASPQSSTHFRRMLQIGSRGKLTADEIESLVRSLPSE